MVNFGQTNDNDDIQQSVNYLSHFIYLPSVTQIKFPANFNISTWKYAQFILQACTNVAIICIITRLLVLSKFIDNPSLIPIFKKIKTIVSIPDDIYFPSKFVERFPSLRQAGLQVFSFDNCVFIIDECLNHLKNLSPITIHYYQDTLLDDPLSRDYIIEKRHETFPKNILNEQMVIVKNNGEAVEIRLS